MNWRVIVPSLAISVLFDLSLGLYFILISLRKSFQLPFLIAVAVYITWSNSGAYKYRFPGMGSIHGVSHYAKGNLLSADLREAEGFGPERPLLYNPSVLDAWKKYRGEKSPKLVLVAVTGGAYRSGFWTAAVLDDLEQRSRPGGKLEGLTKHIRLMTGASGGMVGAAYFAALRGAPGASVVEAMLADSRRDSLTPIVKQLVQRDVPMIFCPIEYQRVDRGVVLENHWKTLRRPFVASYDGEKTGEIPSLIISPMVVETGERMLISNLDLEEIATPVSGTEQPYLSSAREFFRLFPASQPVFGLHTAVRMSATFPYASPSVSLPTDPPRRLVDAGYYDNYGVNLAAAWAYHYREWIRDNTSGLALIQIYAYPRAQGSGETDPGEATPVDAAPGEAITATTARSFSWLSSPIEGALGARDWSMLYRNEEQLRLLDDTFNKPKAGPRMFETFVFANPGGAAMNWIVALDDIRVMQKSIAGGRASSAAETSNNDQMSKLIHWWHDEPYATGRERAIPAPDRLEQTEIEASSELTPYAEKRLATAISRFRAYLHKLGFVPKKGSVKVRIGTDPLEKDNAQYDSRENTIMVGADLNLSRDKDAVLREYVHHALIEEGTQKWLYFPGVESGLADYFACSAQNDPEYGERVIEVARKVAPKQFNKPYVRIMDNSRRFDSLPLLPEEHDEGEVWSGAFWDLRRKLDKDDQGNYRADVLLFRTALDLRPPAQGAEARAEFVRQLLEHESQESGGKFAPQIREVFQQRGLKL